MPSEFFLSGGGHIGRGSTLRASIRQGTHGARGDGGPTSKDLWQTRAAARGRRTAKTAPATRNWRITIKHNLLKADDGERTPSSPLPTRITALEVHKARDGTEHLHQRTSSTSPLHRRRHRIRRKPRDEFASTPVRYRPGNVVTDELDQSKVKLRWVAEDTIRKEKVNKALASSHTEIGENGLRANLGSDLESDDEEGAAIDAHELEDTDNTPKITKTRMARRKANAQVVHEGQSVGGAEEVEVGESAEGSQRSVEEKGGLWTQSSVPCYERGDLRLRWLSHYARRRALQSMLRRLCRWGLGKGEGGVESCRASFSCSCRRIGEDGQKIEHFAINDSARAKR